MVTSNIDISNSNSVRDDLKRAVVYFGGAFNPPTVAHTQLVRKVRVHLKKSGYDSVLFFVAPSLDEMVTQWKDVSSKYNFGYAARFRMCTEAFRVIHPVFILPLSTIPSLDSTPLGTYDVMHYLSETKYRDKENIDLFYLVGSDKLDEIPHWKFGRRLMSDYTALISPREGVESLSMVNWLGSKYLLMPELGVKRVSSTEVRERLENKQGISGLVSPKVAKIIREFK